MPPTRMTRAQSRARTRQRLLDAAASSIARKGLAATSVEDIVAHAGYTRGAFYSNFSSKCELFVEWLRIDHQRILQSLRALLDVETVVADLSVQLAIVRVRCHRDRDSDILWAEARLHAMRDTPFRQHLDALCAERRALTARLIERWCERANTNSPMRCADYARAVIALVDGLCALNMTMPDALPDPMAEAMSGHFFTGLSFRRPA
ncbi:TetR/AcrR family transcriptional regulator [Burkholderia sp. Bp9142]|uniref:TetR/AcrR family transcriptional regulator n=1 Tax=Burkholderia sp. Bp9142 TaxID=2184573 RepID=UPI0021AB57AB|nr:TetR/AcrR family transcriptional regulator [Burkholderia sp. Bp9142]